MQVSRKNLLIVLIVMVSAWGGGTTTSAAFNAQTRNPTNQLASGTLVLVDTKNAGTACSSTNGGTTDTNVNNNCDTLLSLAVKKPGDTSSARLSIKNNGTIAASALQLYESACADTDAAAETYHGTGSMCGVVQLYIQKYTDATYSTPSACVYGGATGSTCNFSDPTKTLGAFATAYTSGAPDGLGALAAAATNYYEVDINFPSTAGNTYQGRTATWDLTWMLAQ